MQESDVKTGPGKDAVSASSESEASGQREGNADNTNGKSGKGISSSSSKMRRTWTKEMKRRTYPNAIDILAMAGIILISGLGAGLIYALLTKVTKWDPGMINALTYFLQMGFSISFIIIQRRIRNAPAIVHGFSPGRISAPLILWGIVLILVTGVVIEPLLELFPDQYLDQLNQYIGTGGWSILMTVVLAPVMEETLFRGLIQGSISERDGAAKAILISSLLFGILHGVPQQVINAFLIGIILGYIYFRTRSLLTVIILHALNNGISYLLLELLGPEKANMALRDVISNDIFYYIAYGVCALILIIGAIAVVRNLKAADKHEKQSVENNIPAGE